MLATAILELPEAFHGFDTEAADRLLEAAFGQEFPEQAGQIAELREVAAFVATGLEVARDDAMRTLAIDISRFNEIVWHGKPLDKDAA
ncbi:MAG: hypothetical protein KDE63_08390 [Novosphingobium sp.]|nr:hypothetical protein [Paracoccaceae bacterium]MCB2051434.1 hypothetical protein [Novosphingobium sp.]